MKKLLLVLLIPLILLSSFFYKGRENANDFTINANGKNYNVIVGEPEVNLKEYPLVIYHHGGMYRTLEPFELRNLSKIFANEGFLFWAPERTPWNPTKPLETLNEAQAIDKTILDLSIKNPKVNKSNINVVGFDLGSWIVFENDAKSPYIRTVSLLGFGAPYDDTLLYDYISNLVNNTDYSKISSKVLVMVSAEDPRVDIETAENLRNKMVRANKTIDCVEYPIGDHLSLAGNKNYTEDLIKYLKGEKINTSEFIKVDEQLRKKWENIIKTGYW